MVVVLTHVPVVFKEGWRYGGDVSTRTYGHRDEGVVTVVITTFVYLRPLRWWGEGVVTLTCVSRPSTPRRGVVTVPLTFVPVTVGTGVDTR